MINEEALSRIKELEEQNEELHVLNDLQAEQISELMSQVQSLTGQLAILRQDRRYEVG